MARYNQKYSERFVYKVKGAGAFAVIIRVEKIGKKSDHIVFSSEDILCIDQRS